MDSKTCQHCLADKSLEEFVKTKSRKDGRGSYCKPCHNARQKQWARDNPEARAASSKRYIDKHPEYMAHYRRANLERLRAQARANYRADPVPYLERSKRRLQTHRKDIYESSRSWRKKNPGKAREFLQRRRARLAAQSVYYIPTKTMNRLYQSPCIYCGSRDRISIDHVVPISRGGSHSIGNLVPACLSCNCSKGPRTIMEWRMSRK